MKKLHLYHLLIGMGVVVVLSGIGSLRAIAQAPERVGLVIQFDDDTIIASCLNIEGQTMNGQDILQLSGFELDLYYDANQEVAVCRLNEQGCDPNQCFCHFPNYWSYWHADGGDWVYSGRGSSTYIVQPGTVEGWRWGSGDPPPQISFEQICSATAQGTAPALEISSTSTVDGVVIHTVELAGLAPVIDAPRPSAVQPISQLSPVGYLVFGSALISMGLGLFFQLYYPRR